MIITEKMVDATSLNTILKTIVPDEDMRAGVNQYLPIIVRQVVDEIVKMYLEKNSAEIISKIDIDIIKNLASIELGKRASKLVEK